MNEVAPVPVNAAPAAKGPPMALIAGGVIIVIIIIVVVVMMTKKPPVDCVVSEWTNQGSCSKFCGPGEQTQSRTVTTPAANGGAACPPLTQKVPCNLRECNNVDCAVSDWSAYDPSVCTSTSKSKTHTRTVTTAKVDYGAECPPLSEKEKCTSTEVDTVCNFTPSPTPDLSKCQIDAAGAVSGTKRTTYTSTVSGCSKPAVSSTCTSADTAKCNYTKTEDTSKCRITSSGRVSGSKKVTWTSTVAGCPTITVRGNVDCTSADVTASPATQRGGSGGGSGGGQREGTPTTPTPTPVGMVSTTVTATPTFTCPIDYTLDTTKPAGQKCTKTRGRRVETSRETVTCPTGYTYDSTRQLCTKTVMTPVSTPAPAPAPYSAMTPSPSGSSLFGGSETTPAPSSSLLGI
jgi:hypothetical protein